MSVEIELKKLLEANGFCSKSKTKGGSVWTYHHPEHPRNTTVNYHENDTISFNYLAKYMIDEVEEIHGPVFTQPREKKEPLYHSVLAKLSFYPQIKLHLKFSIRAQKRGDYTNISYKAGMDAFRKIVQFMVTGIGIEYVDQ